MKFNEIFHHGMTSPPGTKTQDEWEPSRESVAGGRARILVVEDEFMVAMTIEDTLVEAGYEIVEVVTTGEEAVQASASLRPDLVLMDIRLAGKMTGIEAAVKLSAKGVPSLFVTSHSDPETRASAKDANPVGWLAKPFSDSAVIAAVENALASLRRH